MFNSSSAEDADAQLNVSALRITDGQRENRNRKQQKNKSQKNEAPVEDGTGTSTSQANVNNKCLSCQRSEVPPKTKPNQTSSDLTDTKVGDGVREGRTAAHALIKSSSSQSQFRNIISESPMCSMDPFLTCESLGLTMQNECFEGVLRVNPRNPDDAFVTPPIGASCGRYQWDVYMEGRNKRGRALNGDKVKVELLPQENWKIQEKAIHEWEQLNKVSLVDFLQSSHKLGEAVAHNVQPVDNDEQTKSGPNTVGEPHVCGEPSIHSKQTPIDVILKHPEWGRFVQRTARVVGIVSESGSRIACGHLRLMPGNAWHQISQPDLLRQQPQPQGQEQKKYTFAQKPQAAMFVPEDKRFPRLWIPASQLPKNFFQRHQDYAQTLYCARLDKWPELTDPGGHWEMPRGQLLHLIGQSGDLEAETVAILTAQMIEFDEYTEDILDDLPVFVSSNWTIPPEEMKSRRDFRRELVISIDPSSTQDVDDALSIQQLEDNLYEVGVHIADLSYFIPPGCKVDKKAQSRATSVYLVQKVVPMLPKHLCDLCSLTAGVDKLTFSVVWKMNSDGEVLDEWFGRSVINSSCQLSYEHAQQMLDSPDHKWVPEELPQIFGCWTAADLTKMVNILNEMAIKMRERRIANGCLRLDQIRLQFALTDDGKVPQGFSIYEHSASRKLIEEFMLQANMAVAHKLVRHFPKIAFLRNHPPPDWRRLEGTVRSCVLKDVMLNGKTSGDLQKSLFSIVDTSNRIEVVNMISSRLGRTDSSAREALMSALCNVLSKPFRPAAYFVAGNLPSVDHYRHFTLAVPLYTHFTSPIRRYADLIVHRLLAASLYLAPCPYSEVAALQRVADHCNERKYAAKTAQELSTELFVWAFVRKLPECRMEDDFIVVGAFDKAVDVMSLSTGLIHRAYADKQGGIKTHYTSDSDCLSIIFQSRRGPGCEEVFNLAPLTPVRGVVVAQQHMGKYLVKLEPPPNAVFVNSEQSSHSV